MSDKDQKPDAKQEAVSRKTRGPGVPTVPLQKALEMLRKVWDKEKRNAAPVPAILSHWGYAAKSSGGFLAIASLKRFGLLDELGSSDKRTLKISPLALDLLKAENTEPQQYLKLLKDAALKPQFHRELWVKYQTELPSDQTLENFLVFDKHFAEDSARAFIQVYKDTISFAKLTDSDTVSDTDEQSNEDIGETGLEKLEDPALDKDPNRSQSKVNQFSRAVMIPPAQLGQLPIPVADKVALIPFPMSEEDFDLFIDTLKLWKRKLVRIGLNSITGNIGSVPQDNDGRVTFLLAMPDGQVLSCMSGAGTKFMASQFINGEKITLIGEHKADLILGRTPYFVFSEVKK